MATIAALPARLTTCLPPWCEASEQSSSASLESEPTPKPFALTLPHVLRRNTRLWDVLGDAHLLTDDALKERIIPLCREIDDYQGFDHQELYGFSKALVTKYGETSVRVLRRVWDLHLVHIAHPEIPGDDPGVFDQSVWLAKIRDVYTEDFKAATHNHENGPFMTDVLVKEHEDRVKRATKEREVFAGMHLELTQDHINNMPAYKSTALAEGPLVALRRCLETADAFHKLLPDEEEGVLSDDEEEAMRTYQAFQLWHVAARAAMGWEPRRQRTLEGILPTYCDDILKRRKREARGMDDQLRSQLEAILGDTRGESGGVGSEESSSSSSSSDEDEDGPEIEGGDE
ncbi:hypothetical protein FZEAL_5745 [Fusarium zealandicum]|uniref:Uncharacterized protein n=1 Tax=Fusarium zealandicum TaxID=1053134 RepID=A0A8H4UJV2_9HYPO|nr:hypothetical protein FZEAL_5745 [Fusarium zealandicum]